MAKLTEAEREMLAIVTKNPACAWVTSRSNALLSEWAAKGYFLEVEAPAPFLVAYRITPAGRRALQAQGGE